MDQYGKPVSRTDQFGHPAVNHGAVAEGMGPYGTETGTGTGTGGGHGSHGTTGYDQTTAPGQGVHHQEHQGGHRTLGGMMGDTGMGNQGHGTGGTGHTGGMATGTTTGLGGTGHTGGMGTGTTTGLGGTEKKGFVEKIKDKIPGTHKDEQGQQGTGYGGVDTAGHGQQQQHRGGGGPTGMLHRSGSSSSSSSEDDGQGGRRKKKGLKEKIKEKIPGVGGHKDEQGQQGYTATTTNTGTTGQYYGQEPEKKGFVEKIKDKIPGTHNK